MIETDLFLEYKKYMLEKSKFKDMLIVPMTPKSSTKFPTIVMAEINNSDNISGKTTDRTEYVSRLTYRVSIYVKPIIVDGVKYQELQVMNELKELTYHFFNMIGFDRSSSRRTDNLDKSVFRQEIIFTGNLASWNNSLYF